VTETSRLAPAGDLDHGPVQGAWPTGGATDQGDDGRLPKVCLLTGRFPPTFGGGGLHFFKIYKYLRDHTGRPPLVVTKTEGEEIPEELRLEGVRRVALRGQSRPRKIGCILRVMLELWRQRQHYDILHVMGFDEMMLGGILLGRVLAKKVVVSSVQNTVDDPAAIRKLPGGRTMERLFSLAHRFVCCSQAQVSTYQSCGYPADKVVLIHNGYDPEEIAGRGSDSRARARARFGIAEHETVFLVIGSFSHRKGHDFVVDAVKRLLPATAAFKVLMVGPSKLEENAATLRRQGSFQASVRAEICEGGLEGHIVLAGWAPSMAEVLGASDVYLLPSRHEGFPVSLLEAMAAGLPPVLWDLPYYGGYGLEPNVHGVFVEPFDTSKLAEAMRQVVEDRDRVARMGAAARALVEGRYTLERCLETHLKLYRELSGGAG